MKFSAWITYDCCSHRSGNRVFPKVREIKFKLYEIVVAVAAARWIWRRSACVSGRAFGRGGSCRGGCVRSLRRHQSQTRAFTASTKLTTESLEERESIPAATSFITHPLFHLPPELRILAPNKSASTYKYLSR